MKTTAYLLKLYVLSVAACILLVFTGGTSLAVTVVLGPGGFTNLVVNVPTNEMMIVRTASLDGLDYAVFITSGEVSYTPNDGENNTFDTTIQSHYLAGPCTFIYTNSGLISFQTSVFDYDIVPCSGIETLVATNTSVIQVPAGERFDVLDGSYPVNLVVTLTNGASSQISLCPPSLQNQVAAEGICNPQGFEIAGPLTVTVNGGAGPPSNSPFFLTYFFASGVVQVAGPAIQSPVGSIVTVEESTDLQTWFPAYVATQTTAPKMFYRLQVVQ